jgi:hypothetical protein
MAAMRRLCFAVAALVLAGCGNKSDLPEPLSNKQEDDPCDPGNGPTSTGSAPVDAGSTPVVLPGGAGGIGFDDLRYSETLSRLLVPAGRSGSLDLVDPASEQVTAIGGFSSTSSYTGADSFGVTSADEANGVVYATDRTSSKLAIVDGHAKQILSTIALAATPGYVRYAQPTREVWVTEPGASAIEVFSTSADGGTGLAHAASISVAGAESLEIDAVNHLAFTNAATSTQAIDVVSRKVTATWPNGCTTAKGIAVDPIKGWVLVACGEGRVVVLDEQSGNMLGAAATAGGVDQVAYDAHRVRLYVPAPAKSEMAVVTMNAKGTPTLVGAVQTTSDAHCVVTPGGGQVFVCVPSKGQLVFLFDPFP